MKEDIRKHCKTCATCQLHKLENVKFERKIFKPSLQPMDFICMDLIGEFHPPTSRGHRYALTAVCMLTGFTWCVPLKTKTAEEVVKAYMDHIYCSFGGSIKILTDNGTKFKNKLFKEVISKLGTEFSIHSPPYRPQSNGKIEGFHRFLKTCIGKHINYGLEWDELTPMATACYNFFPNCNARESTFFIMFGRDPINKLNMLLHAATRYFHNENGFPNLEALKNIYQVVAQQLLNSRECYVKKHHNQQQSESPVQAGDLILIKDKTAKSFEPLYKGNYRVVKVHGNNVKIRDYRGNISMVHVTDVKKITLMEQVADEYENLSKEGRFSKKCIPRGYSQTSIGQKYTPARINPSSQSSKRIQLRTLQPQLHPQRLRDHQVVTLGPKQSSNIPLLCRNNRNAILHPWIHRNAIQLKSRLILSKLSLKLILGKD